VKLWGRAKVGKGGRERWEGTTNIFRLASSYLMGLQEGQVTGECGLGKGKKREGQKRGIQARTVGAMIRAQGSFSGAYCSGGDLNARGVCPCFWARDG